MQHTQVVEKIRTLPEPLLREVEDFVDFLLARYQPENTQPEDLPAMAMAQLAQEGGAFDWLDDPAEDIYSDSDGEAI